MTEENENVQIINIDKVRIRLGDVRDLLSNSKEALREIGEYAKFVIKKRTLAGEDVDERPFDPYSPAYKFWRKKWGYPTDKVDLTLTGGMLSSMAYTVSESGDEVKIFFMPGFSRKARGQTKASTVSHPAKAFYLQKKRKFFALSEKDEKKIIDIYKSKVKKVVDKGGT